MSFFSGFTSYYGEGRYETSYSEAIATLSNISFSIISIFAALGKKDKPINIVANIIFFFIFIAILVIYYIKKNEIIEIFEMNADDNLNKIYFTSSIVSAVLYIIFYSLNYFINMPNNEKK